MKKAKFVALAMVAGMLLLVFASAFTMAPAQTKTSSTPQQSNRAAVAWSGWSQVPGNGLTTAGPATTVYQGKTYLFVRGTNQRIYQNVLTNSSWSGWSEVYGNGLTPSNPGVTVYQNKLYLFVQGTDFVPGTGGSRIYQNVRDSSRWSGWSQVSGNGLTPSGPAATAYGTKLYLFVRGTDNRIYQNLLG